MYWVEFLQFFTPFLLIEFVTLKQPVGWMDRFRLNRFIRSTERPDTKNMWRMFLFRSRISAATLMMSRRCKSGGPDLLNRRQGGAELTYCMGSLSFVLDGRQFRLSRALSNTKHADVMDFDSGSTMMQIDIDLKSLQLRHNGHDSVSNHEPDDCLLNRLFERRSKKTSKLRATGLCAENGQLRRKCFHLMTSSWWPC